MHLQTNALNSPSSGSLHRVGTDAGSELTVVKDGWAKVKEEGDGFLKPFWDERFLVLREKQLDFLKNNSSSKTSNGGKLWILNFETDNDVYGWLDSIYDRCPSMGGVSHPTGFSHRVHVGFDPVTGGFVGLPVERERLLKGSALTENDMAKTPQAVMERPEDVLLAYSYTACGQWLREAAWYSARNSVAPPSPQPPGVERMDSYQGARGASGTPSSAFPRVQSAERFAAPKRADTTPPQRTQSDEEERRRKQEEQRRKADIDRRRAEKEQERRRRQGQEDRQYNENTPKQRTPIAKQEMGGYGGEPRDVSPSPSNGRYNAQRPAPPAPTGSNNGQSGSAIPIRNLQASRPAPAPPGQNGTKASPPKQPATNGSSYGAVKPPAAPQLNGQTQS
ncbi:Protein kinase [Friedmanniomyces endolithicus]|nr:Protein kinase [Friedmanniomyces endolithicus]